MGEFTYEHLFDVVRRERSRDEIQELEPTFYADAQAFLDQEAASARSSDALSAAGDTARTQLQNSRKLFKELYDRREKKIMLLALNKARTGSHIIDTSQLLPKEKELFDVIVAELERFRFSSVRAAPAARPTVLPKPRPAPKPAAKPAKAKPSPKPVENPSAQLDDTMQLRITSAIPKFMGSEMQTFGPFEPGAEVSLPQKIAQILIKKGRAEAV